MYDDNGVTRWINNGMLVWHAGLVKDGDDYRYFKRNGMVTSVETYVAKTNGLLKAAKYTFDAEGRLMKLEGLHEDLNGNLCYYVDYVKNYAGLVEVDGSYYYIASDLKAVKNGTYYVTKTNGLKDAGFYSFDADGKMIIKNGLVEGRGFFQCFLLQRIVGNDSDVSTFDAFPELFLSGGDFVISGQVPAFFLKTGCKGFQKLPNNAQWLRDNDFFHNTAPS